MDSTSTTKVRYVIDTRASQFTVQAFAGGLISAIAHSPKIAIRDWSGDTLQAGSLRKKVKPDSLEVLDELSERDRHELHRVMKQEVLESTKFPDILFESFEIKAEAVKADTYRVTVQGMLKLHGETEQHRFSAQVSIGVDSARAYGEFTLLQSHYGIRIASIAGGTMKLLDELKFTFYVVARKQSENQ
jgi:polyisoprenoid-binding protein YceI